MIGKLVICCPTYTQPHKATLAAIHAGAELLEAEGIDHNIVWEIQNPYISGARAAMLRKALDAKADTIVFLDHDVSFDPVDLLKLVQTPDPVVAGLYRFKKPDDPEEYMGSVICNAEGVPQPREDGCIGASRVPAGFLKVTREAVATFAKAYPHLMYGDVLTPSVDLFNHGAHEGSWWGEDYAFSRRWVDQGGEIWVIPDLNLTHHSADQAFPGNYFDFLCRQPGGSEHPDTIQEAA